jgi:hypothetical protein
MKNTLALALLLLTTVTLHSQLLSGLGIKGGPLLTNTQFDYKRSEFDIETKKLIGFNAAVFAELKLADNINLIADAGFEQRGYAFEIIRTDEFGTELGRYDVRNRTNYFSAGITGKFLYKGRSITPYLIAGVKTDIFLSYKVSATDDSQSFWSESTNPVLDEYKKVNYSVNIGLGLAFERLFPYSTFAEFIFAPPVNTSFNSAWVETKDYYLGLKLGINFIKSKKK